MKKTVSVILLVLCTVTFLFARGKTEDKDTTLQVKNNQLVIYAYDSFASEWGPATKVVPTFEQDYGVEVKVISCGDAGQVLNRAILEKDNPKADIILGIDNNMFSKAIDANILCSYKPQNIVNVDENLIFDKSYHLIPFDYGYFAINYDSNLIKDPPKSLNDLTKEEYKKKLILMDPRTSSPGLGFLLWTISVYGDNFPDYWKKLKPSILTITEGWDAGYGLYSSGEAPLVLSYTTSPPYHLEYEKTERFKAAVFKDGNYMQIEAMGILKGATNKKAAEQFIEYMLTDNFQKELPLTNFMIPASEKAPLPDSFKAAPKVDKALLIDSVVIDDNIDSWISSWLDVVVN